MIHAILIVVAAGVCLAVFLAFAAFFGIAYEWIREAYFSRHEPEEEIQPEYEIAPPVSLTDWRRGCDLSLRRSRMRRPA